MEQIIMRPTKELSEAIASELRDNDDELTEDKLKKALAENTKTTLSKNSELISDENNNDNKEDVCGN